MSDSLIGRQLNNFRIERLLGRGGMAAVYYGTDLGLNRSVAIKVIDERWRDNEAFTSRFVSEARTIATWRNENIIQVYYAAQEGNLNYFVMEYIEGETLEDRMKLLHGQQKLMPYNEVLRIARAIASGLDYAHQKGVIHRDVKPSNIMIDGDERVVIMDFGLALDIEKGTIGESFGTPHYIAPEQARDSSSVVPQSDQYALGVMLYEMLTGAVPFDNPSAMTVALMHMTEAPPRPSAVNPKLTPEVEAVLLKVLNKLPVERFESCTTLVKALETAIAGKPTMQEGWTVTAKKEPPLDEEVTARMTPVKALQAQQSSRAKTAERPALASQTGGNSRLPLTLGAVVIFAILIIGVILALSNNPPSDNLTITQTSEQLAANASAAAQVALNNTDTPIPASATQALEPSMTSTLAPDPTETDIPATDIPPSATPTDIPATEIPPSATYTNIPATDTSVPPTATKTDIPASTTPTTSTSVETAIPTLAFPQGSPITLFYDNDSFYVWNQSGRSIRSNNFKFEAIDKDGNVHGERFEGNRWSQFYSRIDNTQCVAIEITTGRGLRPTECTGFNAVVTTTQNSDLVFWRETSQFRVLWNDSEVAQCESEAGRCDFNIP